MFGILIVLTQFSSYIGWEQLIDYWTWRFQDRGLVNPEMNKWGYALRVLKQLATGFLPAMIFLVIIYTLAKKTGSIDRIPKSFRLAIIISLSACILNSIIFLNWAAEHDFAVIPYVIPLALFSAWIAQQYRHKKHLWWLATALLIASITQYYYINFPGPRTSLGVKYASYKNVGSLIQSNALPSERIFTNTRFMPFSYFAKRSFTQANSFEEAASVAATHGIKDWVWIKIHESSKAIFIEEIKRPR